MSWTDTRHTNKAVAITPVLVSNGLPKSSRILSDSDFLRNLSVV